VRQQDEEKLNAEHEIQTLKDQLTNKRLESDKEQTRKKHMEKELKVIKSEEWRKGKREERRIKIIIL
jgi:hypothetical protein